MYVIWWFLTSYFYWIYYLFLSSSVERNLSTTQINPLSDVWDNISLDTANSLATQLNTFVSKPSMSASAVGASGGGAAKRTLPIVHFGLIKMGNSYIICFEILEICFHIILLLVICCLALFSNIIFLGCWSFYKLFFFLFKYLPHSYINNWYFAAF